MTGNTLTDGTLPPEDMAAIDRLIAEHFEYARKGQWRQWTALCSDRIAIFPPGGPAVSGREAVQDWMGGFPPIHSITNGTHEIMGSGRFAVAVGSIRVRTVQDRPDPPRTKWMAVYEKDSDGRWAMVADIWNEG